MGENFKQSNNQETKQSGKDFKFTKGHRRLLYGSVFLMATSAIVSGISNSNGCFHSTILC